MQALLDPPSLIIDLRMILSEKSATFQESCAVSAKREPPYRPLWLTALLNWYNAKKGDARTHALTAMTAETFETCSLAHPSDQR